MCNSVPCTTASNRKHGESRHLTQETLQMTSSPATQMTATHTLMSWGHQAVVARSHCRGRCTALFASERTRHKQDYRCAYKNVAAHPIALDGIFDRVPMLATRARHAGRGSSSHQLGAALPGRYMIHLHIHEVKGTNPCQRVGGHQ